jgi:DNA adenine methylase
MIPKHKCYVEPCFGSGAVFFCKPFISSIETINDLNSDIFNLFSCIQKDAERLAKMVLVTPYSRDSYNGAFEGKDNDPFDRALAFLVKCWQGMGYRANGEKVGWKCDSGGREKMYSLWNWYNLPNDIIDVCERLRAVQIENCDAVELIDRYDCRDTFMYLDPPYLFTSGCHQPYVNNMSEAEHELLLKKILGCSSKIMISGYESDMYNDYLSGWTKVYIRTQNQGGTSRDECLWTNYHDDQISIFDL